MTSGVSLTPIVRLLVCPGATVNQYSDGRVSVFADSDLMFTVSVPIPTKIQKVKGFPREARGSFYQLQSIKITYAGGVTHICARTGEVIVV